MEPWTQLASEIAPHADPKALRIAHQIHLANKADATILFGSRARGTHSEASDIDVAVINGTAPDNDMDTAKVADAIYQTAPDIEIVAFTTDDYEQLEHYRNTAVTEALLQGVVIAANPQRWSSRYAEPEPAPTEYEWSQYRYHFQMSKMALDAALFGIEGKLPSDEYMAALYGNVVSEMEDQELERWCSSTATTNLRSAMRYGLMAVIASVGALPKKGAPIPELLRKAREATNETELDDLKVAPEEYDRSDELELEEGRCFNEQALADVRTARKIATRHYRRTKRQYG